MVLNGGLKKVKKKSNVSNQATYDSMDKFEVAVENMIYEYGAPENVANDLKDFLLESFHALEIGELYTHFMKEE